MTQIPEEQREALQPAGWTEEEAVAFARMLASPREGLPPRRREALTAILTAARGAAGGDVRCHLVVLAIIGILIHMLLPAVQ